SRSAGDFALSSARCIGWPRAVPLGAAGMGQRVGQGSNGRAVPPSKGLGAYGQRAVGTAMRGGRQATGGAPGQAARHLATTAKAPRQAGWGLVSVFRKVFFFGKKNQKTFLRRNVEVARTALR